MHHTQKARWFISLLASINPRYLALTSLLMGLIFLLTGPNTQLMRPVKAATLCVNPGGTGGCYATITAAVAAAASGDTINVAAGTYAEAVTVNKSLTILGANANVVACGGSRGAESIVGNATGAFNITANNVVIDGFTLQGNTNSAFFGSGVIVGAGTTGTQLLNNIIQNNIIGINLGGSNVTIQGNLIQNNNNPGPASGTGIYSDQFVSGGSLSNVQISSNCFTNNSNVGVLLGSTLANSQTGITVSNNSFTGNGNAVLLFNTTNSSITGNQISGSTGSQVVVGGGVNGLQITGNTIINGSARGIRVEDLGGGSANANVTVGCNRIVGNPSGGLVVAAGGHTGTLNAENNWWGCNAGPGGAGCDAVSGSADFTPWLVLTLAASPNPVPAGSNATLTASLNTNSAGQVTGCGINGAPASFSSTCGTVNPALANTASGNASTTLTAGVVVGPCNASTTIDNQNVVLALAVSPDANSGITDPIDNPFLSDQKAGSVLVFPYYNSSPTGTTSDTLIQITNVCNGASVSNGIPNYSYLHLFFMKGCSPADTYACLTPNGTIQILASVYDPGVEGYLVAVAVDANGVPTQNNCFIGSAYVRDDNTSFIDSYGAESFWKYSTGTAPVTGGYASINLNGADYDAVPTQFSVQVQDPSIADEYVVLASVSGDLGSSLASVSQSGFGVVYRADEVSASFQPQLNTGCFSTTILDATKIRVATANGGYNNFLKDSYGYLKFNVTSPAVGLLISKQGPVLDYPFGRFSGIRTLHKTQIGTATLLMPVFPPFCF